MAIAPLRVPARVRKLGQYIIDVVSDCPRGGHQIIDLLPVALRRGIFVAEVYSLTHGCGLYNHNQGHRMVDGEGLHLGEGLGEPFEAPNNIPALFAGRELEAGGTQCCGSTLGVLYADKDGVCLDPDGISPKRHHGRV